MIGPLLIIGPLLLIIGILLPITGPLLMIGILLTIGTLLSGPPESLLLATLGLGSLDGVTLKCTLLILLPLLHSHSIIIDTECRHGKHPLPTLPYISF